jgi:hypothetical protein
VTEAPFFGGDTADKVGNFNRDLKTWGIGPRIGAEVTAPLWASPALFVNLGISGSVLWANVKDRFNGTTIEVDSDPPGTFINSTSSDDSRSRTLWNVDASAALGYRLSPNMSLQVGYRAERWWNLLETTNNADKVGDFTRDKAHVLSHGAFGKLTVEFPAK